MNQSIIKHVEVLQQNSGVMVVTILIADVNPFPFHRIKLATQHHIVLFSKLSSIQIIWGAACFKPSHRKWNRIIAWCNLAHFAQSHPVVHYSFPVSHNPKVLRAGIKKKDSQWLPFSMSYKINPIANSA